MLILWDVDDVLNQLMSEWFSFWQQHQKIEAALVEISQITSNPPNQVLGIPLEKYLQSLDEFRNSSLGKHLTPHPQVLNWFEEFGDKSIHIALTARPSETMSNQSAWVYEHFGRWIHSVVSVNPCRSGSESRRPPEFSSKGSFIKWLDKPSILIDDNEDNIRDAREYCLRAFLFPQPWNSSDQATKDVLDDLSQFLQK